MYKKYIVRLNDAECEQLNQIVKTFSSSSQKVRRAQILLKSDTDGPAWTDKQIADAFGCRIKTVENVRQTLKKQDEQSQYRMIDAFDEFKFSIGLTEQQQSAIGGKCPSLKFGLDVMPAEPFQSGRFLCMMCHR